MSSDGSASLRLGPTTFSQRIVTLDVLRGIALFGVLTANIWMWFSGVTFLFPGVLSQLRQPSIDSFVFTAIGVLISGKAIRTFSFLFGLGFALQMMRAEAIGRSVVSLYIRRLTALMAIGVVHAVFLWYGDILLSYAMLGFGLLLFRRRSQKTVLIWAAILIVLVPIAVSSVPFLRHLGGAEASAPPSMSELNQTLLNLFASAQPGQIVQGNLIMLRRMYLTPKAIGYVNLFGFFLLGLYVGRARWFENPMTYRRPLRRLAAWGLSIGLFFALVQLGLRIAFGGGEGGPPPWFALALTVTMVLSTTPFAFGYIAAATLLLDQSHWRTILGAFAPVGRMALTNYLAQTLICLAIFYGGGLVGRFHPALGLIIGTIVFVAQMGLSAWWLHRFRFGPAEWLWRSLTYGQLQPMRIERIPAAIPVTG